MREGLNVDSAVRLAALVALVEVVLDHDDLLRAVGVRLEHALDRRVLRLALAARDVPRVADHQLEVVVAVDRRADVLVVVLELFDRHDAVLAVRLPHTHELLQYLLVRLAPRLHVRVVARVVRLRAVRAGEARTMRMSSSVTCPLPSLSSTP